LTAKGQELVESVVGILQWMRKWGQKLIPFFCDCISIHLILSASFVSFRQLSIKSSMILAKRPLMSLVANT
jgi:hypothetical protein